MDLASLLAKLVEQGVFSRQVNNPNVQFGPEDNPLLGATILPERVIDSRFINESEIRYRSNIANAGSFFSPVQRKASGYLWGSFEAAMGNADIGGELTGQTFEALQRLLNGAGEMEATAELVNWVDLTVTIPLAHRLEKDRWDSIVDAQVIRVGDNGFEQVVDYPNPTGHRITPAFSFSDPAEDPYVEIFGMVEMLAAKGIELEGLYTSRKVATILARNPNVARRSRGLIVLGSTDSVLASPVSLDGLQEINQAEGLPPFTLYEGRYQTTTGGGRFLKDDVIVFRGRTGRSESVDLGPEAGRTFLADTAGYVAVGPAAGFVEPGRQIRVRYVDSKPVHMESEGWMSYLVVHRDPEAFAVLKDID